MSAELGFYDVDDLVAELRRRGTCAFVVILDYPDSVAKGQDFRVCVQGNASLERLRGCVETALEMCEEKNRDGPEAPHE